MQTCEAVLKTSTTCLRRCGKYVIRPTIYFLEAVNPFPSGRSSFEEQGKLYPVWKFLGLLF